MNFFRLIFHCLLVFLFLMNGGCEGKQNARSKQAQESVFSEISKDLQSRGLEWGSAVYLRAFKEEKVLELFVWDEKTQQYVLFRSYPIAAASGTLGPKLAEGDQQVPEGFYYCSAASMNPESRFHLAFNVGYPNEYDRAHHRTGSAIMVHGNQVSVGCLAMTDAKIEEIYSLCDAALQNGQKFFRVHIFPFRMTEERMQRAAADEWYAFWQNLKEGYDFFEKNHVPPNVTLRDGKYAFE